jgi:hypothetical protein
VSPLLITVGAVTVLWAAHSVSIPGIDPELGFVNLAMLTPMAALLCLRGLPAALGKAPGRGLLVAWLAVVALQSRRVLAVVATAAPDAIVVFGLRFELVLLVTALGLGALFWAVADLVARRGLCSGALILFAVEQAMVMAPEVHGRAQSVAHGTHTLLVLVPYAAFALAFSATCLAAARRPPTSGLLRALDLALLPVLAVLPAALARLSPVRWAPLAEHLPWLVAVCAWGIALWVLARTRANAPATVRVWASVAAIAPAILVVAPVADVVLRGERSVAQVVSGPLAGSQQAEAMLISDGGDAEADAPRLVARLKQLGVRASAEARNGHIFLTIDGAADVESALAAVLPRRRLSVHPMSAQGTTFEECDCDKVCRPRVVGPAAFDASVVESATAEVDPLGSPVVRMELSADGAAALLKLSTENVGKLVAFVVDGRVEMAPNVREPIPGGRLFLLTDRCPGDDPVAVGHALAAGLAHPTSAAWRRKD